MDRHPFRVAVEAHDMDAAVALLHDEVVFRSPAVHVPYAGRPAVSHLLRHAGEVLQDLVYLDELHGEGSVALVFRARVGDKNVEGLDHLTIDEDGRVTGFRVMIRPLSGLIAMARTMGERLEIDPVPGPDPHGSGPDQPIGVERGAPGPDAPAQNASRGT